jgi:hypothetical protein
MTLKNAAAGLPHGGGKSVLRGDPRMAADQKERLIRNPGGGLCRHRGEESREYQRRARRRQREARFAPELAVAQVKRAMSYRRFSIL